MLACFCCCTDTATQPTLRTPLIKKGQGERREAQQQAQPDCDSCGVSWSRMTEFLDLNIRSCSMLFFRSTKRCVTAGRQFSLRQLNVGSVGQSASSLLFKNTSSMPVVPGLGQQSQPAQIPRQQHGRHAPKSLLADTSEMSARHQGSRSGTTWFASSSWLFRPGPPPPKDSWCTNPILDDPFRGDDASAGEPGFDTGVGDAGPAAAAAVAFPAAAADAAEIEADALLPTPPPRHTSLWSSSGSSLIHCSSCNLALSRSTSRWSSRSAFEPTTWTTKSEDMFSRSSASRLKSPKGQCRATDRPMRNHLDGPCSHNLMSWKERLLVMS